MRKYKITFEGEQMNMKIRVLCRLTSMMILGLYSVGFANSNPYTDVPADDWSYVAVESLIQKGLVTGYNQQNFKHGEIITRSDMAVIVAKAMSKRSTVDLDTKILIDKLVIEYKDELKDIGVRETGVVESKMDRFSFNGTARVRFDKGHTDGKTVDRGDKTGSYTPNSHLNLDLNYTYQVNNSWSLVGESEFGRQFNYAGENETLQNSVFEQMYVTGPFADTVIKAGRFSSYSPMGLAYDDKVTGAQISFGKVVKTTLQGGIASSNDDSSTYKAQNFSSVLFDVPLSSISNFHAGYYRIEANPYQHQQIDTGNYVNYYTAAFDSQMAKNWNFKAAYNKSDAVGALSNGIKSNDTKAYEVKVTYKNADMNIPKSYDIYALYRKSPQLASYSNTDDWHQNVKGFRIGLDYTIEKNVGLCTWYTFGKDVDTNKENNTYRIEWDFAL